MKVRLLSANTVHHTVKAMTLSNATDTAAHSLLSQRLEKDVISDHATFLNYVLLTRCKVRPAQTSLPVPAVDDSCKYGIREEDYRPHETALFSVKGPIFGNKKLHCHVHNYQLPDPTQSVECHLHQNTIISISKCVASGCFKSRFHIISPYKLRFSN